MATSRLHVKAREMKEDLVRERGVADLAPFMLATTDDDETYLGKADIGFMDALGHGARMGTIAFHSVKALRAEHDGVPVRRLMLVVEGFSRSIEPGREDLMPLAHGDLAKDFEHNPGSDVVEVLMTNVWVWNGTDIDYQLWITPFHYTEGGVLVWGEDLGPLGGEDSTGAVMDAGKRAMR